MIPNAHARHFLLKAKQRDLIAACGGIERAALICNFGKSTVGRWANPESPEIMPLEAIFALEEECGRHDMSQAIAEARGRRFAEADMAKPDNASILATYAETVVQAGELIAKGALAFADGRLTPAEASGIDRVAATVEAAVAELRRATAATRAAGGTDVGGAS